MIKQYSLYNASITQSRMMVVIYRYTVLLVVTIIALALWLSQVVWSAIIINSVINLLLLEYCLQLVPAPVKDLRFNDTGLVVLRASDWCIGGNITDNSLVCDWLCLLIIKQHGASHPLRWQVIWRDMVDDESYRRLSRVVRIKRRLI